MSPYHGYFQMELTDLSICQKKRQENLDKHLVEYLSIKYFSDYSL